MLASAVIEVRAAVVTWVMIEEVIEVVEVEVTMIEVAVIEVLMVIEAAIAVRNEHVPAIAVMASFQKTVCAYVSLVPLFLF